jgi:chemotaxis signal transduction protein
MSTSTFGVSAAPLLSLRVHAELPLLLLPPRTLVQVELEVRPAPLPLAPAWMPGLVAFRGRSFPVIDLGLLQGLAPLPGAPPIALLPDVAGGIALRCSALPEFVQRTDERPPTAAPENLVAALSAACAGFVATSAGPGLLFDPERCWDALLPTLMPH